MKELLYFFELYLISAPNAYYKPALETNNLAVIIFCIVINVVAIFAGRYILDTIKELCSRKPTR